MSDKTNGAEPLTLEGLLRTAARYSEGAVAADRAVESARVLLTAAGRLALIADLAAGLPEANASARYAHLRADGEAFAVAHHYLSPQLDITVRRALTEEEHQLLSAYPANGHGDRCGSLPLRRAS